MTKKTRQKVDDALVIDSFVLSKYALNTRPKSQNVQNHKLDKSSKMWMQRHLNDEYVKKANEMGYCARSAFKIIEIQEKFKIFTSKAGKRVLDLGSAPGGWSQVMVEKYGFLIDNIIAVDMLDMEYSDSKIQFIKGDFLTSQVQSQILANTKKFDVILSDIAPNTTGIRNIDHLQILNISEEIFSFAGKFLAKNGSLVTKIFMGEGLDNFVNELRVDFANVNYFKPRSSRKESKEIYLVCCGYKKKQF